MACNGSIGLIKTARSSPVRMNVVELFCGQFLEECPNLKRWRLMVRVIQFYMPKQFRPKVATLPQ
jgi:hypothetical protein